MRDVVYAERDGFRPLALDLHLPAGAAAVPDAASTRPPGGERLPVVLFLHGGGWQGGSRREFGPEVERAFERITEAGFAVASVDYRLSGEAVFPAQVDDVLAAIDWLRDQGPGLGLDATRLVLWGESAGATLAMLVGLRADPAARGVIDWYGPTDFIEHARALGREHDPECSEAKWFGATVGADPATAAAASPARQVHADAPPFLIVNGTADTSVPPSQAVLLADALAAACADATLVLVEGAGHRWEGDVDRDALLDDAIAFARRVVASA
jgi:acetyl esterase/lipase